MIGRDEVEFFGYVRNGRCFEVDGVPVFWIVEADLVSGGYIAREVLEGG